MANYSLSVSSTFQPFSYQELALPIDRQDAYFEKLAEEYDKLSSQADILEAMGANDRDRRSGTYGRYKSYSDALRQEADNLYRNGLNSESRQRLSDLRRRYNTDIVPIQNAWNKREQEADMQLKASLQNPSIMFTRDARNTSLDDYITNPAGGFGVINGANITAQMSAMAKNLEKQVMSNNIENIDPFTYNHIQKFGLDENLIRNWQDSPTLKAMFEQVMQANGVTPEALSQSANMQDIINKSIGYAEMGMWNAMGTEKSEIKENYGARLNAQAAKELSVYRAKKDIDAEYAAAAGADDAGDTSLPGETFSLNFNDAESAGAAMRSTMADATLRFLQTSKDPEAKKYLKKLEDSGGIEAAVEKWKTEGIDGDSLENGLYTALGNYLRDKVTKNENLINIWRSGYAKKARAASTPSDNYNRNTYQGLDMYGNQINEATYNATRRVPGRGTIAGAAPGTKDWKDFDDLSTTGYHVNAIQLNDDQTALSNYLERIISRNSRNGKIKLYDIKKIDANNNYTYSSEGMNTSDLPHTSSGKDFDLKRIHRAMLSNGDYLLWWLDDNGKDTVEKVLKRSDIGNQAVEDWNKVDQEGYRRAHKLYSDGLISKEYFNRILKNLGITNMANAYLDTQEVKVKDYELE